MNKTINFPVNKQEIEEPKPATARELVSELALSEELHASTKEFSRFLKALSLNGTEYESLLKTLHEYVLDAQAWAFEQGVDWGINSLPIEDTEE